jgi:hypothetical protein
MAWLGLLFGVELFHFDNTKCFNMFKSDSSAELGRWMFGPPWLL